MIKSDFSAIMEWQERSRNLAYMSDRIVDGSTLRASIVGFVAIEGANDLKSSLITLFAGRTRRQYLTGDRCCCSSEARGRGGDLRLTDRLRTGSTSTSHGLCVPLLYG